MIRRLVVLAVWIASVSSPGTVMAQLQLATINGRRVTFEILCQHCGSALIAAHSWETQLPRDDEPLDESLRYIVVCVQCGAAYERSGLSGVLPSLSKV